THYLYQNQFDGEYLLPEFKHMDFLWLMKDDYVDEEKCNWILQTVRNLSGVQLVAELTNEQIKNKGNMIF
ncbi:IPExxxVDY family protein, partial [Acinetobacter baumannii]